MPYASLAARSLAYIIDSIAVTLAVLVTMAISIFIASLLGTHLKLPDFFSEDMLELFGTLTIVMALFYQVASIAGAWQATPGMRLFRIHVIRQNGEKINFRQSGVRAAIFNFAPVIIAWLLDEVIPFGGIISLFWVLPIGLTQGRAGIHDMICHMRVVKGNAPAISGAPAPGPPPPQ